MELRKEFTFAAAHSLPNVPEDHKCRRLHGHTYRVVVVLDGPVDPEMGWVVDFGVVADVWRALCEPWLDHRLLNDTLPNPTAELLAEHLADVLEPSFGDLLAGIEVWETPSSMAALHLGRTP